MKTTLTLLFLLTASLAARAATTINAGTVNATTLNIWPAAGGAGFDVSSVTGYTLDYDVDALALSDGDLITSLTDQGPNGFHLLDPTGTAPSVPYWTNGAALNGKAFAYFNGSSTWLQTNFSSTLSQPNTVFVVARLDTPVQGYSFMFDCGSSGDARECVYYQDPQLHFLSTTDLSCPSVSILGEWKLYEFHFNGASSLCATNGVTFGSGDAGTQGQHGFTLGSRFSGTPGSYGFTGAIGRVLVYNSDVSGADLTNIREFCRTNYNLW